MSSKTAAPRTSKDSSLPSQRTHTQHSGQTSEAPDYKENMKFLIAMNYIKLTTFTCTAHLDLTIKLAWSFSLSLSLCILLNVQQPNASFVIKITCVYTCIFMQVPCIWWLGVREEFPGGFGILKFGKAGGTS